MKKSPSSGPKIKGIKTEIYPEFTTGASSNFQPLDGYQKGPTPSHQSKDLLNQYLDDVSLNLLVKLSGSELLGRQFIKDSIYQAVESHEA